MHDEQKVRILFVKKSGRQSGGHVKFHDYFDHAFAHPQLEPNIYLTHDRSSDNGSIWEGVASERFVREFDVGRFDLLFIDGRDWELLLPAASHKAVIHLLQDFRHADPFDPRFAFLSRPATRICVSAELAAAVRRHANGPMAVIPNGIPIDLFAPGEKRAGSVLIWARKDRELGKALRTRLREHDVRLLTRPVPREEFAGMLAKSEVFVGLTRAREGFFLPAIEAMASGCAVVCADAIGNRGFCIDGQTCRFARFGDVDDHARLVEELLSDREHSRALRQCAIEMSQTFTLQRERELFYALLEQHVFSRATAPVS